MKTRTPYTLLIFYLVCTSIITDVALGDYNVSYDFRNPERLPYRTEAASFVRDSTLYTWGGRGRGGGTMNSFDGFYLDSNTGELVHTTIDSEEIPPSAGSAAVLLPNNNRVLFFGGDQSPSWGPTSIQSASMYIFQYDFTTQTWTSLVASNSNESLPMNVESPTATLASNGKIYIYGGQYTNSTEPAIFRTAKIMWIYDPEINYFSSVSVARDVVDGLLGVPTALPDGRIVYLSASPSEPGQSTRRLRAAVFDTNTNETSVVELNNSEVTRLYWKEYEYGFLGHDQRTIYYYGGIYHDRSRDRAHNTLAALNTDDWTWWRPNISTESVFARPRYDFIAGVLNDSYLLVGLGRSEYTWYTQFDVLRLSNDSNLNTSTHEWVTNITSPVLLASDQSSSLGKGTIAGIVIGAVAVLVIVFIVWKWFDSVKAIGSAIYTFMIWDPRTGEPRWTEVSHLMNKIVLTFLFGAYFTYNIILVLRSPIATTTLTKAVPSVLLPEARVCTDHSDTRYLVLRSQTDQLTEEQFGELATIRQLNLTKHYPYFTTSASGRMTCWTFNTSDYFKVYDYQSGNNSRIKLAFGGISQTSSNDTRIQIELYPPGRNPNQIIYNDMEQPSMTDDEIQEWRGRDLDDIQGPNKYSFEFSAYVAISYQIQKHRYLKSTGWNNVGFLQDYNEVLELSTSFQSTTGDSAMRNTIDIYPMSMTEVTLQEQKVHTLLGALGAVGGLYSLLVAMDCLLFGTRPKSPWGLIQRFSIWRAKKSLLDHLYNAFGFLGRPIPYIEPVHDRFEDPAGGISQTSRRSIDDPMISEKQSADSAIKTDDDELRRTQKEVQDLQRRLQLMEAMFRAYYINDEVFQKLGDAHDQVKDTDYSEEKSLFMPEALGSIRRRKDTKTSPLPAHRASGSDDEDLSESRAESTPLAHG
ncbi:hypothetical protein BJV82DRAFT_672281 [Fennellomyces sp. T-0311]|nr:hypothetical protein BJV82DRAFT_672281 [Fennellomyces sp. T-0311]